MKQEKKLKKNSVVLLMGLTLGSRILGLLREAIKSRFLGGGATNDAFNIGFMIPNLLRRLFAESSMTAAFIPTFKGYLKDDNKKSTKEFLNSIFTALSLIVTATVIIGIFVTPILVKVFNKENADIPAIIDLTRIMFPYLIFISIAALLQGILNSLNIFSPAGFVPILFNIIIILSTIFLSKLTENPAIAMAIGVTLGGFVQMAFQLPFVIKNGYGFRLTSFKKAFNNPGTKNVGRLLAPTLLGMGAYQLSSAVANIVAIKTGTGVSSALNYSLRLQELVLGIFAVSIGTILISTLSKNAKDKNWKEYTSSLELSLNAIALLTIPVTIFSLLHAREIVAIVYQGGVFTEEALIMTAGVFRYHIAGLFFIAVTRIVGPAFYSLEDSKTPAILGIISLGCGTVLMIILAPILKANGLAIAVSTASLIQMVLYFIYLQKKDNINFGITLKHSVPSFIKILIYSVIAITPVFIIKERLFTTLNLPGNILNIGIPLTLSAIIFFSIYLGLLILFREKSLKNIQKIVKRS